MSESQQTDVGSQEPLLLQKEIAPFIRRMTGIPIGDSTIPKVCAPSVNDGPPVAAWLGRRPLYERAAVIRWAKERLSPAPRPSAHNLPPEPKRESGGGKTGKRQRP